MELAIDDTTLSETEQQAIRNLRATLSGANFVNIRLRSAGGWREFSANWLKHLEVIEPDGS